MRLTKGGDRPAVLAIISQTYIFSDPSITELVAILRQSSQ